ncbi:hypothetical protein P7C70_g9483, partial [Phenoliferia sp. Uapishka_3]
MTETNLNIKREPSADLPESPPAKSSKMPARTPTDVSSQASSSSMEVDQPQASRTRPASTTPEQEYDN